MAFRWSGLTSIVIPAFVGVLGKHAVQWCLSLASIAFEADSESRKIAEGMFAGGRLTKIVIPASVGVIGECALRDCKSLASVIFEAESNLMAVS
jgi:hypothetical protein